MAADKTECPHTTIVLLSGGCVGICVCVCGGGMCVCVCVCLWQECRRVSELDGPRAERKRPRAERKREHTRERHIPKDKEI